MTSPDRRKTNARYLGDICVRSKEDLHHCHVIGMVTLSGNRIIVADWTNVAAKLIDVTSNNVTFRLSLTSQPFDVTKTAADKVAVALGNKRQIEILTVNEDSLCRTQTIDVPGDGFTGLCYDGRQFVVLYDRARAIKTVDMVGMVKEVIYVDVENVAPVFQWPRYIALSKNVVYITDWRANTATGIKLKGQSQDQGQCQVNFVYRHDALRCPKGVVVGRDGCVYVCSQGTHSVHEISSTGEHVQVLLDRWRHLAECPRVIAFDDETNRLLISSESPDPDRKDSISSFRLEL